ncbi:MAG: hypothetical protein Q8Q08_03620 [Candidatus Omnitrophota bacterium]|nr:hypothetical protein [Candidatus Omnitrophota bacterium]
MKQQWLVNLLGFFVLLILIVVLAAPYLLVIYFPDSGADVAEVSKVIIPWMVIMFLILIFNTELKWVITNFGDFIKRTKKVGIGSSTIDTQQDTEGLHLTKEQAEQMRIEFGKIQQEKDTILQGLTFYFHKFLYLTVYRSQVEMLQFLANSAAPIHKDQLKVFYEAGIARNQSLKQYPYERYLAYLKDNFLITIHQGNGNVEITPAGRGFLQAITNERVPVETFPA